MSRNEPTSKPLKVVVAMSGGVDSSVAAALMKEAGHEVIGIMLRLWSEEGCKSNRCCTPESIEDASLVADQLGIPFYVRDYKDHFKDIVVEYFIEAYQNIVTPNPCLVCNKQVRFGRLLDEALTLGADYLVTGHYVRTERTEHGILLKKGFDEGKDQSYVLYQLGQKQLEHCLFPLGEMQKSQVRNLAEKFELPVAKRPDSQDLCFIGDGDYRDFLQRHGTKSFPMGDIVDQDGKKLGRHNGLPYYTIGQRRGLGVSGPEPYYVTCLDVEKNRLILGTAQQRGRSDLFAKEMRYTLENPPTEPMEVMAKVRYKAQDQPATLTPLPGGRAQVEFRNLLPDITPGQAVVLYQEDMVIGGGIIE